MLLKNSAARGPLLVKINTLFVPGNEWDIYAPGGLGPQLEKILAGQMEYTYFPVTLAQLGAAIRYHDLAEGAFMIGGVRVVTQYLNHPALAMGYRLEAGGAVIVYSTDHEPNAPPLDEGAEATLAAVGGLPVHGEDRRHVEFLTGADLVIHDSQYTVEEYRPKVGWGHTPAEWAVDYAVAAGAKRLALFHHDPLRTDQAVDELTERCRRRAAASGSLLDVFAAAEGEVVEVAEQEGAASGPISPTAPVASVVTSPTAPPAAPPAVLVADDDPTIVRILTLTLEADGFRVLTANDGETALRLARSDPPALMLLDWQMPGPSGIEVTRILRRDPDPRLRDVPVVLITAQTGTENTALGFTAGVTDYLTKPFRPAHVRSRVRAWLLRRGTSAGSGA
jgi:CheY-like chemotaxis protein